MRSAALLFVATLLAACAAGSMPDLPDSDAPDARVSVLRPVPGHASYADALKAWRTPGDVNDWIGARFEYDMGRALALSESQRERGPAPAIHEPGAFYDRPVGVCVDLARFAVDALTQVAPELKPRYLMIEFDPTRLQGQTLRRHWVVVYEQADGIHVFADSKRPGVVAGPYPTIAAFIDDYASYRKRPIVAFRELEDHRRKARTPRAAIQGSMSP
jgi:ABC-type amino acid transport substrate-binding protein